MPQHSQLFGFDVPNDFPLGTLETFFQRVLTHGGPAEIHDEWRGACNGLLYRFIACADADEQFRAALARAGTAAPLPERVIQETALFSFFVSGLSALECLAYGLAFVGALADPSWVRLTKNPRDITLRSAQAAYQSGFPQDALTTEMTTVQESAELRQWKQVRDVLTHRSAPPRTHHRGLAAGVSGTTASRPPPPRTTWLGQSLTPDTTRVPRQWLAESLGRVLVAADAFAIARL